MFKKETYIARREQLRKDVGHGLIIMPGNHEAPCNYKDNTYWFRQDSTFLYFFGLQREDMVGVLDCETGKDYIFANDRRSTTSSGRVPCLRSRSWPPAWVWRTRAR